MAVQILLEFLGIVQRPQVENHCARLWGQLLPTVCGMREKPFCVILELLMQHNCDLTLPTLKEGMSQGQYYEEQAKQK